METVRPQIKNYPTQNKGAISAMYTKICQAVSNSSVDRNNLKILMVTKYTQKDHGKEYLCHAYKSKADIYTIECKNKL